MGVEGGTISAGVGAAVSIGPSISAGPAIGGLRGGLVPGIPGFVSEGPARGFSSLAGLGAKLEAPLQSFVHEGSVAPSFLENTMPIFKPIGEIKFNPAQLNTADVISQAESILSQARVTPLIEQGAVAEAEHWLRINKTVQEVIPILPFLPRSEPVFAPVPQRLDYRLDYAPISIKKPAVRPMIDIFPVVATQVNTQLQAESRSVSQLSQPVVAPALQKQEVEGVIEEEKLVHQPTSRIKEEVIEDERVYLEDEPVSEQRRVEVRQAIDKAKPEAEKLGLKKIPGWLVAKFMPAEHPGNRSQIVKKKGPDGSYQETVEAIAAVGELESEQQARNRFNNIIAEKSPVKLGKQGRRVGYEVVARVFKYFLVKVVADEIIQKRIVKKTVQTFGQNQLPTVETPKIRTESTIEDNPDLAAVFNSGLTD